MSEHTCKVGLVGTGYIADYHAKALARAAGTRIVAVCDTNHSRAAAFAARYGIAGVYDTVEAMLGNEMLSVVHVLTPPDHHAAVGDRVLGSGAHLFLEKPMCVDVAGCEKLLAAADRKGLSVGVNHNFLFHPAYEQLRNDVRGGVLGTIDQITITWALELPQLRSGPFDTWALRHPANIMFEIGAHGVSQMLDLVPPPDRLAVYPTDEMRLPDGNTFYRRWQVMTWCGRAAVDMRFSFAPGFADRSIQVRGHLGLATADLERNTYSLQRHGRRAQDFGKYEVVASTGRALMAQARQNLADYVLSKFTRRRQGNAFAASIARSISAFYAGLGGVMDPRCGGQMGRLVIEQCGRIASSARLERTNFARASGSDSRAARAIPVSHGPVDALVLGGTGFIGRELVRQLLQGGRTVRLMTRSRANVPFDGSQPGLQIVTGDVRNPSDVMQAVQNTSNVFLLARSPGGNWNDYYQQDVAGTRMLAECWKSAEHKEAVAAFMEKRPAVFRPEA